MSAGILCKKQVHKLIASETSTMRLFDLSGHPFKKSFVSASAIDLPLGDEYWEMKGSCRTGSKYKVPDIIRWYSKHPEKPKTLGSELVLLKKRHVYLFRADCKLDLRGKKIRGKATGRSSIGRLDVLVRLLVNESEAFDVVDEEKEHELYVEVTPISFDLQVKQGTVLSQLRLFKGKEHDISLTRGELFHEENEDYPVLDEEGNLYKKPCAEPDKTWFPFRLDLSPDPVTGFSAFVAKENEDLEGLPPIDPDQKHYYDPKEYWQSISQNNSILLEPDRLYIMRSKERLRIPPHLALECQSYTTQMGEWRIEYAGFAHPHFGRLRADDRGAPIMFEVRGHNVPTILTNGIPLGNVRFLRMSQGAEEPKESTYDEQELALSKCFKPWV